MKLNVLAFLGFVIGTCILSVCLWFELPKSEEKDLEYIRRYSPHDDYLFALTKGAGDIDRVAAERFLLVGPYGPPFAELPEKDHPLDVVKGVTYPQSDEFPWFTPTSLRRKGEVILIIDLWREKALDPDNEAWRTPQSRLKEHSTALLEEFEKAGWKLLSFGRAFPEPHLYCEDR